MGFIDKQARLAQAANITASAATTDYYDFGSVRNIGDGEPMCMVFTMTADADYTTTDEAYTFAIQCDDNTSFTTPNTLESRLFSLAANTPAGTFLKAGMQVVLPFPTGLTEQYVRGYLTLGGTTPICTYTCDIMPQTFVRKIKDYPSSFAVL